MPRFGRVAWQAAQECGMTSPERGRLIWVIGDKSVRAGLVASVEDYSFAGSMVYPIAEILAAVQMLPPSRKSG